jgi:hypothetical protein
VGKSYSVELNLKIADTDVPKVQLFQDIPGSGATLYRSLLQQVAYDGYLTRFGNNDGLYEEEYARIFGTDQKISYDPVSITKILGLTDLGLYVDIKPAK